MVQTNVCVAHKGNPHPRPNIMSSHRATRMCLVWPTGSLHLLTYTGTWCSSTITPAVKLAPFCAIIAHVPGGGCVRGIPTHILSFSVSGKWKVIAVVDDVTSRVIWLICDLINGHQSTLPNHGPWYTFGPQTIGSLHAVLPVMQSAHVGLSHVWTLLSVQFKQFCESVLRDTSMMAP